MFRSPLAVTMMQVLRPAKSTLSAMLVLSKKGATGGPGVTEGGLAAHAANKINHIDMAQISRTAMNSLCACSYGRGRGAYGGAFFRISWPALLLMHVSTMRL